MTKIPIERLPSGRDFVDSDGDVRHVSDLLPDMEPIMTWGDPVAVVAAKSLATTARGRRRRTDRRGGRSSPEISGRDIAFAIDQALTAATAKVGRDLTEDEVTTVTRQAEWEARWGAE